MIILPTLTGKKLAMIQIIGQTVNVQQIIVIKEESKEKPKARK